MTILQRPTSFTANEALAIAETMSHGEAAQMAIAAELLGVDYDTFIAMLYEESQK